MSVYIPQHFASRDDIRVAQVVHDHPFATLITPGDPEPFVTHLPLLLVADGEPHGTLFGHFARANPHARSKATSESVAIFHGPHAYVTPSWYADPAGAVPTWNYAVAHVHGVIELATDPAETRAVLDLLVDRFESGRAEPWRLGLAPDRLAAMVKAIVGFKIRVTRIEAKFKLSQNRSPDDQRRVAVGLAGEGYPEAIATAKWMRKVNEPG